MYAFLKCIHFGSPLFYEPFSAEELHLIVHRIKTRKKVLKELERIRHILIELETPKYAAIMLPKDCRQCISKFSQLFRALLMRRDLLVQTNPESDSEHSLISDQSSETSYEDEVELIL
jgi:hypothetical protein